jgi:hypothetical protein
MSTRAVIGYTLGDGRWRGVWNHSDSHTDYLGRELIQRAAALEGDLAGLVQMVITDVPGGWSNLYTYKKGEGGGTWTGTCSGETATFDGELPDAHFLYLLNLADRRLRVFEIDDGPCDAFTSCVFDANGDATPAELPSTLDDDDDDDSTANPEPRHTAEQVLAAAQKALGARTFEASADDDTGVVHLFLVVCAADKPASRDEVDLEALVRCGIEADDGDELLFPIYYRRDDMGHAHDQRQIGLAAILDLPADTIESMQRALVVTH